MLGMGVDYVVPETGISRVVRFVVSARTFTLDCYHKLKKMCESVLMLTHKMKSNMDGNAEKKKIHCRGQKKTQ